MTFDSAPVRAALDTLDAEHVADVTAAVAAATDPLVAEVADLKHQIDVLTHPPAPPTPATIAWGSSAGPIDDATGKATETQASAIARVLKVLGAKLLRFFVSGIQMPTWPTITGSTPLVISFKLLPDDVLAGKHDAGLAAFFAATPRSSYWSYWHEPENDGLDPAKYRAAWRHIAAIAKASPKASLLRSVLILMGWTVNPQSKRIWTDWYPGGDVIDVLGWDCYAWALTTTPAEAYDAAHAATVTAGKPFAICETGAGTVQHNPAQRQAKLKAMATYLAGMHPVPEFVTYFDSEPGPNPGPYGWRISNDPAAAAAWAAGQAG